MSNAPRSVSARLRTEVEAGRFEADASQTRAAQRLDALGVSLRRAARSDRGWLHAVWPWRRPHSAEPRGLYLWGGVGRGKTLLMDWFYDSLTEMSRERTHFYRFMRSVHAELRELDAQERPLDAVAARLSRHRVICLDELFVSDIGDAMILAGLLRGLLERGVVLVTTSNSPPRDLYKDGLQRQRFLPAIDLLESHLDVVNLDGSVDYRLRQLEQAPTYLDSADPHADARLRRRFETLAGGNARGPAEISIEDRPIAAIAVAPGLAWFEFAALCQGPRSQNDYIEIARLFHTVVVSHIPILAAGDEDAARRCVMLIDELYDRGVKLIVSAAAPPAELYRGERLTFEFQRAASRLMEMQTQSYLAGRHRP